jgi:hypothetical protein
MKAAVFILLLIIMGVSISYGAYGCSHPNPSTESRAEGKYTFETDEGYGEFKRFIGREDVRIERFKVYASEPPIVVNYKLRFPAELEFPYGDVRGTYDPPLYAPFCISIFVMAFAVNFALVVYWTEKKKLA